MILVCYALSLCYVLIHFLDLFCICHTIIDINVNIINIVYYY